MHLYDENGSLREYRERRERENLWRAIRHAAYYTVVFIWLAWLIIATCKHV